MNRENFFGEAYLKWFRRTEAVLRRHGANPDLAQELAQAAWAKAWQCLLQLRDDRRILQFVNTIAIRLFLDEVARSRRMTELPSVAAFLTTSPVVNIAPIDLHRELHRALRKCPTRQRMLLETVYLQHEDHPTAEVAAALGITADALLHRLSRGRRALRKAMSAA
jgi:RNA polymerase sigma factor (sigma-70 family)